MKLRYELRDSHYEDDPSMRKAGRFTKLADAERALAESIPPGRFYLFDRETKRKVA